MPFSPPPPCSRNRPFQSAGKRDGEADAVRLAVPARPPIERRVEPAVGRQLGGQRRNVGRLRWWRRPRREPMGADLRESRARNLQLRQRGAHGLVALRLGEGLGLQSGADLL